VSFLGTTCNGTWNQDTIYNVKNICVKNECKLRQYQNISLLTTDQASDPISLHHLKGWRIQTRHVQSDID